MYKVIGIIALSVFFSISSVFADIERVSISSAGEQGNSNSDSYSISADGRFVVFTSNASNLVAGDTNNYQDIFVHDRNTGMTERVSISSAGDQGNGVSFGPPSISADGRIVVFMSEASNLIADDTNNQRDIFVHDRDTGMTERASVSSAGDQGNRQSYFPVMSPDGRFVAFISQASNLVENDTNGGGVGSSGADIFVHDRDTGMTERVSVSSAGDQGNGFSAGPAISSDGRFVVFHSFASNLIVDDTNNSFDVFVHDRNTGKSERVSISSAGDQGNGESISGAMSTNGRFVIFTSNASNLVAGDTNNHHDTFVHDRNTGMTERVSVSSAGDQGNDASFFSPSISADGRFVAFMSAASNLIADDINNHRDNFVHDRQSRTTARVNTSSGGGQESFPPRAPYISADGHFVAFASTANNLVDGDTNEVRDVFVTENPHADSTSDLISIEVLINGKARKTLDDAAQLQTGTLYEVNYKVTNNSPDRLSGVQVFENGELVCDVYALNPGQTKQRSRCKASRIVMSGGNQIKSIVTGNVTRAATVLTNNTDTYYTGLDNATGTLGLTHRINNINADSESQAPTLASSQASVSFKIENTGDIELYRVKTYHDPASPVNSGWDQQCFIGTLKPGQIRYCKRDISLSPSGLHKAWGRVQGKSANVSPTGSVNAFNPTYFIVP